MFKVLKKSIVSLARLTQLHTSHGKIVGPFFMPIATFGTVKNLTSQELNALGASCVLSNTYHLMVSCGEKVLKKIGGLHTFMRWDKPILTDSGGYQVYSLSKVRKIHKNGVMFREPKSGQWIFLTPEKSIQIQYIIGSDIMMVFDECIPYPCTREYAESSLKRTTQWAKRCKEKFHKAQSRLLFGIIQGGIYKDLRRRSAQQIVNIGFDGYAIGGVAVGEPREKLNKVLEWVIPELPENKPRYLMGVGRPEEILKAVKHGIDMFDCVIPTREARHGRLYKWKISNFQSLISNYYETINIHNKKFKNDIKSVDKYCHCYTCLNYSRAYIHHLFRIGEPLAMRLATIHNLAFYLDFMDKIRLNIKNNEL